MTLPARPYAPSCDANECYWFGRFSARALASLETAQTFADHHTRRIWLDNARRFGAMAREAYAKATASASFWR